MSCQRPLIRDGAGEFSGDCIRPRGLKELHRIRRTLPRVSVPDFEQDVLQDDPSGFAILDEQTGGFIFDDLR